MQRYLIDQYGDTAGTGIIQRDDHYYIYISIRNIIKPYALTTPTSVNITITDPCGDLVVADSMVTEDVGLFSYETDIDSDAKYGRYIVEVSTITHKARTTFDFHVMPWDAVPQIRRHSGIEDYKSISDDDLASFAWKAYKEVLDEVFEIHKDVKPKADPDTGDFFNGTNVEFRTCDKNLADHDGDGLISDDTDSAACDGDITGWWYDDNHEKQTCRITVCDSQIGKIKIYQDDGATAIPSDNNGVYLTYWTKWRTFREDKLREATEYLAAHNASKRFHEMDRATIIDINSNKAMYTTDKDRLEKLYKEARDKIRKPICGGV